MAEEPDRRNIIIEFCIITGASRREAQQFLESNHWDLSDAAAEYYMSQEEDRAGAQGGAEEEDEEEEDHQESQPYAGPRTLDGRPAPTSAIPTVASSSRPARQPPRTGFATLDSLNQGPAGGHGHAHDDDDDDDDDFHDDEQPRDLFAGGEKSGLAVQDPRRNEPRKLVNDILKKAEATAKSGTAEPAARAGPSHFRGSGHTVGGDDTPSQVVPDPNASDERVRGPPQVRVLHFWADGFSVEDGPLHRYDDPQNAADLAVIRSGRAPLHLMNVVRDQPIDVHLAKHDGNYVPPPKVYKPFGGSGQRLGSPTPGESSRVPVPVPATAAAAASSSTASAAFSTPEVGIDPTQPTLTIRIQLANGTRLPAHFNPTHTIGDVYGFIERAYPGANERPWVLATTFPSKEHTDKSAALGDVPEFKKGGTAVQKWV